MVKKSNDVSATTAGTMLVELPILEGKPDGYISRHLDVQLSYDQGIVLRRLFIGMDESGVRLKSGKRVTSLGDVVRYLLEQA